MKLNEINPQNISQAELIVAIPTLNEADTISLPTRQAAVALRDYFKERSSVIVNCDNNSTDGTREAFLATDTGEIPKLYVATPAGIRGKGSNLKILFRKAIELKAKAIVVLEAGTESVTPQWVKNLAEPIFNDFGYVAPLYVRHKYDASLTNAIVYPLTRCLYGRRVRQPIGGDFAFSGEMARIFATSQLWNENVSLRGIDIWMTTIAMNQGFPICQAFVGRPKIHRPKDPGSSATPMFRQVVGTIFEGMLAFASNWTTTRWSKPTAIFGFGLGEVELPPMVEISRTQLYESFRDGYTQNWENYRKLMPAENLQKLREIASLDLDHFELPPQIWAKILFDFAVAYKKETLEKARTLDILLPLYRGMLLSFVNKTSEMSIQQAEEYLEEICVVFEQTKPYLVDKWNQC
ncbi:MAG: hypothetical protein BWY87_00015 [Deltaproteobacteria bacterium ADurb.Bin510]|nr:MAG: hypothetical protein BWY87_00015 [Deltaproteobacteria bacterium ADurb.Bin510]